MSPSAVDRCLALIEMLAGRPDGASLGALAELVELPKSAVHRLLQALAARGYVTQDPATQDYQLSLRFAALGFRYLDLRRLPDVAQVVLDRLAKDAAEYCRIALIEEDGLVWIARAQGATQGLRYEPAMDREVVLHATATGKAWLATMPEEEALALVYRRGFRTPPGFGPRILTHVDDLRRHLLETRQRGYAIAIEEGEAGIAAMATTFRAFDGPNAPVAGTLSIAGPLVRLDEARIEALAPRLHVAARELAELWPLRRRQRSSVRRSGDAALATAT